MVTYSLITVLSPIIVSVLSPLNFKSWGISPIELECKILHFIPIFVFSHIVTLFPMIEPSPIIVFDWITEKGPIFTFIPN